MHGDDDAEKRIRQFRKASPYLVPKEVAAYLRLDANVLSKMRARNQGPRYSKHGRVIRYHIDDVEAWLKENSHDPKKP